MTLKTTNWQNSYANYLWGNIPDLGALLIIDKKGNITAKNVSKNFEKEYNLVWFQKISNKISVRFSLKDFDKEMEGLNLTINVFKKYAIVVRPLKEYLLVLIVPSSTASLPEWIRKNAQWWADDLIFEEDFVDGLHDIG